VFDSPLRHSRKCVFFLVIFLGIETSCDETALAAILVQNSGAGARVLKELIYSQVIEHQVFGGVVPEQAARMHIEHLPRLWSELHAPLSEVAGIGVTAGPGLMGGLLVGSLFAKGLGMSAEIPVFPVNHLQAHVLVARMFEEIPFPYIALLISGGHCQILRVSGVSNYVLLGQTKDDAVGECLDKVGRTLGLLYPAGPAIEKLAVEGCENAFSFTRPLMREKNCDFSFSGLKTAANQLLKKEGIDLHHSHASDFCASFQKVVAEHLADRLKNALSQHQDIQRIVVAGGVSANRYFYHKLQSVLTSQQTLHVAPLKYCTDNAVMVAWSAFEQQKANQSADLHFVTRPRWPLSELMA
jgi:N6-L-threonylcarbamoyladenine synthase